MKTLTAKIQDQIEGTKFQILGTAKSKMSEYWYLWNNENGEMPETTKEDDPLLTKIRYSNHDAMCGRSKSDNEVVNEGYVTPKGNYYNVINLELDFDAEDLTDEELTEELESEFGMTFENFDIEDKGFYSTKLQTKDFDSFETLVAIILTKNLK
ncbi:MAG: hypothetical protein ACOC2U_03615 [bacterium]